jgi:hypothetical protein
MFACFDATLPNRGALCFLYGWKAITRGCTCLLFFNFQINRAKVTEFRVIVGLRNQNFKFFQENSEVKPNSTRIELGWLTLQERFNILVPMTQGPTRVG